MDQDGPRILITTTHRPSEQTRSFIKLLRKIIPRSIYEKRGSLNETDLLEIARKNSIKQIMILHSQGNSLAKIKIKEYISGEFREIPSELVVYQYIDHRIFGWERVPVFGPLSTNLEARLVDSEILDYFENYFQLQYEKKTAAWLLLDKMANHIYIQFIDAMTQRPFAYLQVNLKKSHQQRVKDRQNRYELRNKNPN